MVGGYWELQAAAGILATAANRVCEGIWVLGIPDQSVCILYRVELPPDFKHPASLIHSSRTC